MPRVPEQLEDARLPIASLPPDVRGLVTSLDALSAEQASSELEQVRRMSLDGSDEQTLRNAFLTPPPVAVEVVQALRGNGVDPSCSVLEPSCGAGTFLVEWVKSFPASERLEALANCYGMDIEPEAVRVTRVRLWLLAAGQLPWEHFERHVVQGDALDLLASGQADLFSDAPASVEAWPEQFDVVLGNPPFGTTSMESGSRGPGLLYMRFVQLACDVLAPAGRWSYILPLSFLGTESGGELRRSLLRGRRLAALHFVHGDAFAANVETCAPVVMGGVGDDGPVQLFDEGTDAGEVAWQDLPDSSWSFALAKKLGVPDVASPIGGSLGDLVTLWVPHHEWFYDVKASVDESSAFGTGLLVLGVGNSQPLGPRDRPLTVGGVRFERPAIEGSKRPYRLLADQAQILIAPQSALLKCVPDPGRSYVPLTPVFAVICPSEILWQVTAYMQGPIANALLARAFAGAARSADAIRGSSSAIRRLPVPVGTRALDAAGALVEAKCLSGARWTESDASGFAELCCDASGVAPDGLVSWWLGRFMRMQVQ